MSDITTRCHTSNTLKSVGLTDNTKLFLKLFLKNFKLIWFDWVLIWVCHEPSKNCINKNHFYQGYDMLKSYSQLYCNLHHSLSWIPSTGLCASPVTLKNRTMWSCTMLSRKKNHPVGNPKCAEWPVCPQKLTSGAGKKILWVVRCYQSFIISLSLCEITFYSWEQQRLLSAPGLNRKLFIRPCC